MKGNVLDLAVAVVQPVAVHNNYYIHTAVNLYMYLYSKKASPVPVAWLRHLPRSMKKHFSILVVVKKLTTTNQY